MGSFEKIAADLKEAFSKNSITKTLLSMDTVLFLIGVIYLVLYGLFPGLGLGSGFFGKLIYPIAFWGCFLFGAILVFANMHLSALYIGFFLYGALHVFKFFWYIKFFNLGYLVIALLFGGLGYLLYQKTAVSSQSES